MLKKDKCPRVGRSPMVYATENGYNYIAFLIQPVMSLCINPTCSRPNHPDNDENRFCQSCGSQLELLGRYRVMRLLSDKTGNGLVYEAYEQVKPKILKVLREDLNHDAKAVELFQQEAAVLGRLDHPGIPKVDGYFQYHTRTGLLLHCMAMEKIEGSNLEQWLMQQQNRPIATEQALAWLKQLAEILDLEQQLCGTTAVTVNVLESPHEQLSPTTTIPPQHKQKEKLPLLELFAALLVVLGCLGVVALATRSPKFASFPTYGQAPERKGKVDYFPYEEGRDSQGRVAEFNIAVLSVEYKWLLGSDYQVKYNDQIINLDALKSNLEAEGIQRIMQNPTEIISVGTASCEGTQEAEERRAFERSKQIQLLGKKIFSNTPSVQGYRLLNLGQFQRSDCQKNQDLTAYQRSIIIIGVKKKSEGVILDEALRNRLEKKPFADFKLEDYSLGSPEKFKTIPSNL